MNYSASATTMNSYFTLAKNAGRLPSTAAPYMAQYTQGYNYLKRNQYQQAESYFGDAVRDIKRNRVNIDNEYIEDNIYSDALLRLGDCLFKRNAYDNALDRYNEAIQLRASGFVYALFQKAIILGLQKKRYDKIIALEDLIKSYPKSAYADDALLELGNTYTEMGQLNDAVAPLTRLVNDYGQTSDLVVEGLLKLGLISYNLGDVNAALNHYKAVFDYNPTAKQAQEALDGIEEIYVQDLGDPNGYVEFLEQTRGTEVKSSEKETISFKAAEAQFENGNYEGAAKAYGNYLKQFPKGAHVLAAHFRKGESHLAQKNYSAALKEYKMVIEKGPSPYYAPATEKAAIISYNHEENFEEAAEYYLRWSKVATSEEDRFEAQLGGLEAAYRADMEREVKELAEAVYEHPNASQENKATALFYKAKVAYDKGQYNQALSAFNEVTRLSDNENTAESRFRIAEIYYKQKEYDLAETLCRESYKESSNYPYWVAKSLILLSDILMAKEDVFNAKAALEAVIENFQENEEILKTAKEKLENIKASENE
jgi:TolA-binding protein